MKYEPTALLVELGPGRSRFHQKLRIRRTVCPERMNGRTKKCFYSTSQAAPYEIIDEMDRVVKAW